MATAMLNGEELWRSCAEWLTRCDAIRRDHRANLPTAGIVDFANILRDGVLLCNLLNILDPGCIDFRDVNQKPQMAQVTFTVIFVIILLKNLISLFPFSSYVYETYKHF